MTLRRPQESLRSARATLGQAASCPPEVHGWCLLAIGDADLKLFRIEAAIGALTRALDLDGGSLSAPLVLRLRLTLASARLLHGDTEGAWALIDACQAEVNADLGRPAAGRVFAPVDIGALRDRRARLLIEAERPREALPELDAAVDIFASAGADEAALIALNNRGLVHLQVRRFSAARADLERVERLANRTQLFLVSAAAAENLGYLAYLRGDYPRAVEALSRAERAFAECGIEPGQLWIDKAKVYLAMRELPEAEQAAREAARLLRAQRKWMLYPSANLILADIALLAGDTATAVAAAQTAARAFRRVGRGPSAALARLTLLRARHAQGVSIAPGRVRSVARVLQSAGHVTAGVEAHILAARVATASGSGRAARLDLERAAELARGGPAHARAQGWLAEAMVREADGRRRQAYLALSAGVQVLAQHRASVGSSEVRARIGLNRQALAAMGLTMALQDGDAPTVHVWAEHTRATAGLERPGRPPDDDRLADLLDQLRASHARREAADIGGGPDGSPSPSEQVSGVGDQAAADDIRAETRRQIRLEQQVRQHLRRTHGEVSPSYPPLGLRALAAALGELALVEYIEHDGRLHALTLVDGVSRLTPLGLVADVTASWKLLTFALERLARLGAPGKTRVAALALLRRSGAQVRRHLLDPLDAAVVGRDLVIVAPPTLHALPWALVPGCRGRAVSVSSSATLWALAADRRPQSHRVVLTAGPGLPDAVAEAQQIASLYPGSPRRLLLPPASTASEVADALPGARLAHFAAHGDLRAGNPSFSALWLADGPYMVHDIERLSRTPHHVVLAACDTARSLVIAGREVLGLTTALLGQDTCAIVAPTVTIPDAQTRPVMVAYHRRLSAGEPPARALAGAQVEVFESSDDPHAVAAAAAFVCLGAGHSPVFGVAGQT